jgi:hypothetical protein
MKEGGCSNIASYHWSVYYNKITDVWGSNPSYSILITMAYHDKSVRERVVALVEEGGLSASAACGRLVSQGRRQEHGYRKTGRLDKLEGA